MITMAVRKTGISRDLIIHPGETIADVLEDRGITQAELAARTGVSPAYVSNIIKGKKDISAKFAMALEYALDVPKSFWLNLQANYDSELLELNEGQTVTDEERKVRDQLGDIVKYLRSRGMMPVGEKKDASILSLRKALQISNIANLGKMVPCGAFRLAESTTINSYVLGAWLRMCQIWGEKRIVTHKFDLNKMNDLIDDMKQIMLHRDVNVQQELTRTMELYGIDFSVVKNFRGAPVQGYISQKNDGTYQIVMTIRGAYADIFWFSLFHEIGHIVNGDVSIASKFIDDGTDRDKEIAADLFASNHLLEPKSYHHFVSKGNFSIGAISKYAATQNVMPYVVIGRLQKEGHLEYYQLSNYKLRYKWKD